MCMLHLFPVCIPVSVSYVFPVCVVLCVCYTYSLCEDLVCMLYLFSV